MNSIWRSFLEGCALVVILAVLSVVFGYDKSLGFALDLFVHSSRALTIMVGVGVLFVLCDRYKQDREQKEKKNKSKETDDLMREYLAKKIKEESEKQN